MAFETALSGLNAASSDLDIVGNNIANSNTAGFKSSRGEFADIFAVSNLGVAGNAIGQGVALSDVNQEFAQGQFEFTGSTLDMAVNGDGFFQLSDGQVDVYTRAGAFKMDRQGYIVNSSGKVLQGFPVDQNGDITSSTPEDLQISFGVSNPQATTSVEIDANIDASEPIINPAIVFDTADPSSYNHSTSTTVFDSQGESHQLTTYYRKNAQNTWNTYTYVDNTVVPPENYTGVAPATNTFMTLNFDEFGNLDTVDDNGTTINNGLLDYGAFAIAGKEDLEIIIDYSDMTQYGGDFSVNALSQDGFSTGEFTNLDVDAEGNIFARFSNGQASTLGKITVVTFPSPGNLKQAGDTTWQETFASGLPIAKVPGDSGAGSIESGALEQSNVNLTEQLVKMITAQRNFQANAQMISTSDQVTQTIINIR
ncbi:MAG: flagellar hook protein FlgE [Gammaproteobacteria bacterium]|nr:MAG: flagellar hook protein FlgE [Gammaproteobacteria bacterium]